MVDFTDLSAEQLESCLVSLFKHWYSLYHPIARSGWTGAENFYDHLTERGRALYLELCEIQMELDCRGYNSAQIIDRIDKAARAERFRKLRERSRRDCRRGGV